jgi:putative SOS response-associated peptidase YedK
VASAPTGVLVSYLDVDEVRVEAPPPSWNVAPTDPVPAVVERDQTRRLGVLRWGLVPSWAKDRSGAARLINARAETLAAKPAFRNAFERRRCLLPAAGFYEWERRPGQPRRAWFIHRGDGAPMVMAGVWEVWRDPDGPADGELVRTCTIVTTRANAVVAPIHDRMPVLLERDQWATWLDRDNRDTTALQSLLVPAGESVVHMTRVGERVNSVRNNGPDLVAPVPA